jgi:hypothetical protein
MSRRRDRDVDFGSSSESDSDDFVAPKKSVKRAQKSPNAGQIQVNFDTASQSSVKPSSSISNDVMELPPSYLVELAKSGRAECKRCNTKINDKCVRIGILVEGDWGILTRWQHLECTVFHKALTNAANIDGYSELSVDDKKAVRDRVAQSQFEVDQDDIPVDPDELVRTCWTKEEEAPADLIAPLLPFQKEGLGWMLNQEHSEVHGGILADEVGSFCYFHFVPLMPIHTIADGHGVCFCFVI